MALGDAQRYVLCLVDDTITTCFGDVVELVCAPLVSEAAIVDGEAGLLKGILFEKGGDHPK